MTNKAQIVEKSFVGEVEYSDGGEGWRQTMPNPEVRSAPSDIFFRVLRGKIEGDKGAFQVEMKQGADGEAVFSAIVGAIPAAFASALDKLGFAKGAVAGEVNVKALFPRVAKKGDNNPPEEVLSASDLGRADVLLDALEEALKERDEAETNTRAAHLKTAQAVYAIRSDFASKKRWGALKAERLVSAPDAVKRLLLDDVNAVGYLVKFARAASFPDFWDAMPQEVKTPRTFEKEMGALRRQIAENVVTDIREEKKGKIDGKATWLFGQQLSKMPLSDAVLLLVSEYVQSGVAGVKDGFEDAAKALAQVHLDNMNATDADLFTVEKIDGVSRDIPTGAIKSAFGIEGNDELVDAICKVLNGYEAAKDIAEAKGEDAAKGVASLAKAIQHGNKFSAMSAEEAARHLLHILCGKLDDDAREASADEAQAVLSIMQEALDGFRSGALVKADLYANPEEVPDGEEDGEDAADAA